MTISTIAPERLGSRSGARLWLPGLALAIGIACAARVVERYTHPIPDVVLALLAGMILNNATKISRSARPGTRFVLHYVLRTAIILLGAGLTYDDILRLGSATLALVLVCVAIAMGLGLLIAKLTSSPERIGTLIGVGTAICGGSAILAIGPLIEAGEAELAYAITTIFTFNVVALLFYPVLGHAFGMSQLSFGTWAGTAVNDTSVVVATGYIYGQTAGATATVVKLTRTLLLAPIAFAIGSAYAVRAARGRTNLAMGRAIAKTFPWFVLGFAALALLNSFHLIPVATARAFVEIAEFLVVVVLAAVGLNVDFARIRNMGLQPLAVGFSLATTMALVSLFLINVLHIG